MSDGPDTFLAQRLQDWVQDELAALWRNLRTAYDAYLNTTWLGEPTKDWRAGNQRWSMACDDIGGRIRKATKLVGPISPRAVGMTGIADGWFVWANTKMGIDDAELPDEQLVVYCQRYVNGQGGVEQYPGVPA